MSYAVAVSLLLGVAAAAICTLVRTPVSAGLAASAGGPPGHGPLGAARFGERRLRASDDLLAAGPVWDALGEPEEAWPVERRLTREDLPRFSYDPLSENIQGMPGVPAGYDGDPNGDAKHNSPGGGSAGCATTEEAFGGMCYQKCAVLTNNTHTNRIAPDACCKAAGPQCLLPSNVKVSGFFPGSGYNIGEDGGHPHPLGLCDGNEELHAGMCYKKCSVLTNEEYPIRSAANTCCQKLPCIWGIKTDGTICTGYGVGGNQVPDHKCPHNPAMGGSAS